ncbi:hypothetical protein ACFYWY_21440 [Streptomyces sp. NPDC002870]|uniref:hypothetical protein n=1 Tax=Streptomyces sp. NPDC002870 TaxID=3364666 RepID=UPI003694A9C1
MPGVAGLGPPPRLGYSLAALAMAVLAIGAASTPAGAATGEAIGAASTPAGAATGEAIVFGTEVEPVTTYEYPSGCYKLPLTAHVLVNKTGGPVRLCADPFCMTPILTVRSGYGSHVASGSGSFCAADAPGHPRRLVPLTPCSGQCPW